VLAEGEGEEGLEGTDVAKIGNRDNFLATILQGDGNLNNPYYLGVWSSKCQEGIVISEQFH
jgi:hypothetical protein